MFDRLVMTSYNNIRYQDEETLIGMKDALDLMFDRKKINEFTHKAITTAISMALGEK